MLALIVAVAGINSSETNCYGCVLEDERIARTILSALLQKDVVKVEVRPNEYVNSHRDTLLVFRIDFGATIREENGNALPTVAVYLLGHKVGDIEEPVIYVRHQSYDYNGNLVTRGMPNAFIDSLTHDSIIVQIPCLHGQINNRLDQVLSVFVQQRRRKPV